MAIQLEFNVEKCASLERVDLSRKGAVDDAIVPLIEHINSMETCYTTSSCSGRITIYCQVSGTMPCRVIMGHILEIQDPQNSKKGCRWILVSHVPLKIPEIVMVVLIFAHLYVNHLLSSVVTSKRTWIAAGRICVL